MAHKWEIHRQAPILKIAAAGAAAERSVQGKYTRNLLAPLRPQQERDRARSRRFGRHSPS